MFSVTALLRTPAIRGVESSSKWDSEVSFVSLRKPVCYSQHTGVAALSFSELRLANLSITPCISALHRNHCFEPAFAFPACASVEGWPLPGWEQAWCWGISQGILALSLSHRHLPKAGYHLFEVWQCVYLEQGSRKTLMASKLTGEANISTSPFWVFSQLIEVSRWVWLSLCRQISNDPQRHPPSHLPPPIPLPCASLQWLEAGGVLARVGPASLSTRNTPALTKRVRLPLCSRGMQWVTGTATLSLPLL